MKTILCTLLFMSQIHQPITIFNFNSTENISSWRILNDDVMGGRSTSKISIIDNMGVFEGNVSLENNGGFAMTQYDYKLNDVKQFKKIEIHLKGDGKTYQFRIKDNRYNRYSYVQSFITNGEEETIQLYLKDFVPQFRGVKLDMSNFDKNSIAQVSILIGDRKNENFKLQIDKIIIK